MKKEVRIALYIVSIVCVILLGAAMIYAAHHGGSIRQKDSRQTAATAGTEAAEDSKDKNGESDLKTSDKTDGKNDAEAGKDAASEDADKKIGENTETTDVTEDTTLMFTGDVLFANSFKTNYDAGGIDAVIDNGMKELLVNADITMVNEEFPFSNRGTQMEDKQYTFRTDPSYAAALKEMGVDVVTLANNHILDYGREALSDTFTTLDGQGILYAGAGDSVERAQEVQVIEVNGKKYGFLAASRVLPVAGWNVESAVPGVLSTYDETRFVNAIAEARSQCDVLVVYVHWGLEHQEKPEAYQRTLAQKYIEAGADVVFGAHSHCLQGIEYIDGKPVFYSLGNFVFGSSIERTMAVEMVVDKDGAISYKLVGAKAENGNTRQMNELEQQQLNDYINSISFGVTVQDDGTVTPQ